MPGLFNDGAKCRNLEIGILMPAEGGKFPGIDAFNLDNSLASIDTRKDDTPSTKNHIVDENIAIESACFDGKDVIFNYRKAVADKFKNLQSKLKVGELEYETLKPLEEDGFYKIRPSVEIEGDQCIILKLVSKNPEWESYPYFVSRKVHTPNLLPALGDSAFQRCLREGGTEGLDMAFRLAEESGREDWLLYLLYCWDLAKILAGQEAGDPPPEGFDPLPNVIPRKKTDYSEKRFSQNVDLVLDDTDRALEKLKKFFDELFESKNAIIGNFIEYALPLVLEISWKFHKIICEQEANQKAKWDNGYIWVWPKFTLFFNIQKYERYFSFFVESFLRANELSKNTNQDSCLLTAIILVWYRKMHTQKTLAEKGLDSSKQIYGQFMAMPEEELLTIMQLVKDSPDCREKLNELFSKYKIEPLECME
jgi:hypothetical protein